MSDVRVGEKRPSLIGDIESRIVLLEIDLQKAHQETEFWKTSSKAKDGVIEQWKQATTEYAKKNATSDTAYVVWTRLHQELQALPREIRGLDCDESDGDASDRAIRWIRTLAEKAESGLQETADEAPDGSPQFHAILGEIGEMHAKKSADYGAGDDPFANIRASQGFGIAPWIGAMIRGNDKMQRIQSFIRNGKLENESVEDSLMDLASYAIIALCLFIEESEGLRMV